MVDEIVQFFSPRPDDIVVEIGPGHGVLTYELLPHVHRLHVVELDKKLATSLQLETRRNPHLVVHHDDALKVRLDGLATSGQVRLIGNLPYNISTPLLFHLLEQKALIKDMLFMLQKEVGERLHASPGSKQYGRLSVMLQQSCGTQMVMHVGKDAFTPPPRVDSVVVSMVPYREPPYPVVDTRAFTQLVRIAFSKRRKTIRNALKPLIDGQQIAELGIDPELRPEQLGVDAYVRLSGLL